jgi:hypothetical protein
MRLQDAQGAYRVLDIGAAHGFGFDKFHRAKKSVPEEEGERGKDKTPPPNENASVSACSS